MVYYTSFNENISKNIKLFEKTGVKINTILDMTAGIGGNTIFVKK